MALLSLRAFTVFLHLTLTFTFFFLGAIHKLHSSHHNGNEYTMAWVEILPEGTFPNVLLVMSQFWKFLSNLQKIVIPYPSTLI